MKFTLAVALLVLCIVTVSTGRVYREKVLDDRRAAERDESGLFVKRCVSDGGSCDADGKCCSTWCDNAGKCTRPWADDEPGRIHREKVLDDRSAAERDESGLFVKRCVSDGGSCDADGKCCSTWCDNAGKCTRPWADDEPGRIHREKVLDDRSAVADR